MITPVLPTYARIDLEFERGEGCWLVTTDGRRYLDSVSYTHLTLPTTPYV